MAKVDALTNFGGCGFGMREIFSFFPEKSDHLYKEIGRKIVKSSGFLINMVVVIDLTILLKLSF